MGVASFLLCRKLPAYAASFPRLRVRFRAFAASFPRLHRELLVLLPRASRAFAASFAVRLCEASIPSFFKFSKHNQPSILPCTPAFAKDFSFSLWVKTPLLFLLFLKFPKDHLLF